VTAQVISSATDAAPVPGTSANKQTLLFILLLVALIVGIALAFLADYLDDHIYSKDDALNLLQLPILGEVPRAPSPGRTSIKQPSA
jgi:capsular polysaccharide biosynthesis protein